MLPATTPVSEWIFSSRAGLPSVHEVAGVNRLAKTTGSDPVPPHKQAMGYRHDRNKFGIAGLTSIESDYFAAPRAAECPVHLEAVLDGS